MTIIPVPQRFSFIHDVGSAAIYQGGLISFRYKLPPGALVSCAMEIEPSGFPDRERYWARMDDALPDENTLREAARAVSFLNTRLRRGTDCFVFCAEGLNRSSFVTVLTLRRFGFSSFDAIKLLRQNRHPTVLKNTDFENYLLSLDG